MWQTNCFWPKPAIWDLNTTVRSVDHVRFFLNGRPIIPPFMWIQNSDFQIFAFPIGHMGSEVMVGSDPLQFFFFFWKGIYVQEGSNGKHCDHGQYEIEPFPIYAHPSIHVQNIGPEAYQMYIYIYLFSLHEISPFFFSVLFSTCFVVFSHLDKFTYEKYNNS